MAPDKWKSKPAMVEKLDPCRLNEIENMLLGELPSRINEVQRKKKKKSGVKARKLSKKEIDEMETKLQDTAMGNLLFKKGYTKVLSSKEEKLIAAKTSDLKQKALSGFSEDPAGRFSSIDTKLHALTPKVSGGVVGVSDLLHHHEKAVTKISSPKKAPVPLPKTPLKSPQMNTQTESKVISLTSEMMSKTSICYKCDKTVYLAEKINVEGLVLHKSCFLCAYCGSALRLGNYGFERSESYGNQFFCMTHLNLPPSEKFMKLKTKNKCDRNNENKGTSETNLKDLVPNVFQMKNRDDSSSPNTFSAAPERAEYEFSYKHFFKPQQTGLATRFNITGIPALSATSKSTSMELDEDMLQRYNYGICNLTNASQNSSDDIDKSEDAEQLSSVTVADVISEISECDDVEETDGNGSSSEEEYDEEGDELQDEPGIKESQGKGHINGSSSCSLKDHYKANFASLRDQKINEWAKFRQEAKERARLKSDEQLSESVKLTTAKSNDGVERIGQSASLLLGGLQSRKKFSKMKNTCASLEEDVLVACIDTNHMYQDAALPASCESKKESHLLQKVGRKHNFRRKSSMPSSYCSAVISDACSNTNRHNITAEENYLTDQRLQQKMWMTSKALADEFKLNKGSLTVVAGEETQMFDTAPDATKPVNDHPHAEQCDSLEQALKDLDIQQKHLVIVGCSLEHSLLTDSEDQEALQEWTQKLNGLKILKEKEKELKLKIKDNVLEQQHQKLKELLQKQIIATAAQKKTSTDLQAEQKLLEDVLLVVAQRDAVLSQLEKLNTGEQEDAASSSGATVDTTKKFKPIFLLMKSEAGLM